RTLSVSSEMYGNGLNMEGRLWL
uniref:Uncharacterized protein n=1 Tax=Amphimedon queenslandica TaxID=400682 RepID=A0A1X7UEF1_AMPQE